MPSLPAPPAQRYSLPAIVAHWLLGLMLLASFCVGVYMSDLPFSPDRLKLYNWHKWAGITILALSLLRLLWRLTHRPPPDAPMPAWQRSAAHWTHRLLYVFFFAVPLAGWAYSSAAGFPVVLFGVLPLPDFVGPDKALAEELKSLHGALAFGLAGLVLLHVAGALKHQLIDRDGLIRRMWPASRSADGTGPPMNRLHATLAIAVVGAFAAGDPAQAQTVVPAQSSIGFTSKQMGVPVDGKFTKWSAQLGFDPRKPEAGKVVLTIDTGSASFGAPETDAEMPKPAWFNVAKFPQASFQSTAIKALGGGRFEVAGKLDIKGNVQDVVVPLTFTQTGTSGSAAGAFTIKRLDFKIGEGEWADTSMVANDVQVKFKLALTGLAP